MFTLTNLPLHATVYAYVTATRVNFDDAEDGVAGTGWIDWSWSRTDLFDSRNDVTPLWEGETVHLLCGREYGVGLVDSPAEVREDLLRTIRDVLGAVDGDAQRGTLTAADHVTVDYASADTWAYCVHVMVKHRAQDPVTGNWTGPWTESDVHITAAEVNPPTAGV